MSAKPFNIEANSIVGVIQFFTETPAFGCEGCTRDAWFPRRVRMLAFGDDGKKTKFRIVDVAALKDQRREVATSRPDLKR